MNGQATIQTWPLTELRSRAHTASEAVKSIKVYSGIGISGSGRGALVIDIRRDSSGRFPDSNFDYLERHDGEYTAVFQPTKEIMFLESAPANGSMRFPFGFDIMNGQQFAQDQAKSAYHGYNPDRLVNKILELEKKVQELENEKAVMQDELDELQTVQGKIQHVANGIFERYVFPIFAPQVNNNQPLNSVTMADNWTKYQIDQTDPNQAIQDALEVLLAAFGNDNLIRIAKRLQENPNLVQTLSNML